MSVLLEFAMFPTDQGESVSAYVSRVIEMIRASGIPYQLTPMGTILETETLEQALAVVQQAGVVLDEAGCSRIYSSLKLDIRKGKSNRLQGKVASIQARIGKVAT
jgi:uncharacterized protein (TIGR00106 family)